ncbi:Calcium-binding protein KIC [Rhynchospora pubera]|uniref:Calcium-binding protein KIC n=1 Tax=Rhynchospora pubera TaxID=906938 RepID=A0AAV8BZP0_9POAL|nr:Calcium-binding protein KIC [Rhynchospora pubera]
MAAQTDRPLDQFEDFFPIMADKLGEEGLMQELCNGFQLLMDPALGLITFESLKRNAALMGLDGLGDDELRMMIREGDLSGDGALNEEEFYILMVRLSPELMDGPRRWLDDAFQQAFGFELGLDH